MQTTPLCNISFRVVSVFLIKTSPHLTQSQFLEERNIQNSSLDYTETVLSHTLRSFFFFVTYAGIGAFYEPVIILGLLQYWFSKLFPRKQKKINLHSSVTALRLGSCARADSSSATRVSHNAHRSSLRWHPASQAGSPGTPPPQTVNGTAPAVTSSIPSSLRTGGRWAWGATTARVLSNIPYLENSSMSAGLRTTSRVSPNRVKYTVTPWTISSASPSPTPGTRRANQDG